MTPRLNSDGCETITHGWLPHDGEVGLGAEGGLIPRTGLMAGNKGEITNAFTVNRDK